MKCPNREELTAILERVARQLQRQLDEQARAREKRQQEEQAEAARRADQAKREEERKDKDQQRQPAIVPKQGQSIEAIKCQLAEYARGADSEQAEKACALKELNQSLKTGAGAPVTSPSVQASPTTNSTFPGPGDAKSLEPQPDHRTNALPDKPAGGEPWPQIHALSTFMCGTPPDQYPCPTTIGSGAASRGDTSSPGAKGPDSPSPQTRSRDPIAPPTQAELEVLRKAERARLRKETDMATKWASKAVKQARNGQGDWKPLRRGGPCWTQPPGIGPGQPGLWYRWCVRRRFGRDECGPKVCR